MVDDGSVIVNGDVTGSKGNSRTRVHMIDGGSVRNNSVVCNGDMNRANFLELFCRDR